MIMTRFKGVSMDTNYIMMLTLKWVKIPFSNSEEHVKENSVIHSLVLTSLASSGHYHDPLIS
jgi:hypothetical protein